MHELKLVRWRDAFFEFEPEEMGEDCIVETVGWIVKSTPKFVSIAGEKLDTGWRAVTHVPAENVLEVHSLSVLR